MWTIFNTIISILAVIVLFLFSLEGFSKQVQKYGSENVKNFLGKLSRNKWSGLGSGILFTAIIQSSSAVSSIIIALVDAGSLSFAGAIPILLGTNVGTTFTAWLVAFKINNLGSILLVLGTLISAMPQKIHLAGKSIFYLGLILFSLDLISDTLEPLKNNELLILWLAYTKNPIIGALLGMILTALVQSSSVVVGLVIILSHQGIIGLDAGIAILIGSNIGTTSTAFIASFKMKETAKKLAKSNFIFNLVGVLIFLPLIPILKNLITLINTDLAYQMAFAHLIFNGVMALLFMVFINPFIRFSGKL
jgi:phosphate:Na+ symporter